jgi:hypothetical protein
MDARCNIVKYLITILLFLPFAVKAQKLSPFKWLPEDKLYHIMAGAAIAMPVSFATNKPILWGTVAATSAGLAKEIYDYKSYGKFDVKDLACTAVSGFITSFIISKIKK